MQSIGLWGEPSFPTVWCSEKNLPLARWEGSKDNKWSLSFIKKDCSEIRLFGSYRMWKGFSGTLGHVGQNCTWWELWRGDGKREDDGMHLGEGVEKSLVARCSAGASPREGLMVINVRKPQEDWMKVSTELFFAPWVHQMPHPMLFPLSSVHTTKYLWFKKQFAGYDGTKFKRKGRNKTSQISSSF